MVVGVPRGASADRRRALGRARAARLRLVPRRRTSCSSRSTTPPPAAAATGCTPIASTRTRAPSRRSRSCSRSSRCAPADRRRAPTNARRKHAHEPTRGKTRGYETLFHRHAANPILTAADWPYPVHTRLQRRRDAARATARRCSCAASRIAAATRTCAPRARRTASTAGSSTSSRRCAPDPERYPEELWGIEDPRITFVDGARQVRGRLHRVQQGRPGRRARADRGLPHASSGSASSCSPTTRTPRCLPRRIDGSFALVHRPMTDSGAHVWISYSPDLRNWGSHKLILQARKGAWWDANKVGLSPPLIETARGWLMLYHGVRHTASGCLYRLGLALFALDKPEQLPAARRLVDLRPRGALRARRRRRQRRLPLRLHHRRRRRHAQPLLRRRRHLRGAGDGQHPRAARAGSTSTAPRPDRRNRRARPCARRKDGQLTGAAFTSRATSRRPPLWRGASSPKERKCAHGATRSARRRPRSSIRRRATWRRWARSRC